MFDGNDLRHFLAVARTGSTLAASRTLRVSQATVSRRVSVLEETLGTALFVRSASGYELTIRGRAGVADGRGSGSCGDWLRRGRESRIAAPLGQGAASAANAWAIPALARLREVHPEIAVEIITTDAPLDLARGDADVAIRFGRKPTQESLIVRHLTDLEECFYANRELVTRLGRPGTHVELARYPMVAHVEATMRRGPPDEVRSV